MPFWRTVRNATSKVLGQLDKCGVPGAGILKAGANLLGDYLGDQLKGGGGPQNSAAMASMDRQLKTSFAQVLGELKAIEHQLACQRVTMEQILEVVTDLKYKAGIEEIEAAYRALLKGSRKPKKTLESLKSYIFELNKEKEEHLNMKTVREYLALVQRKKGKQAAKELGSYVITVKAEYLFIVTLYYIYDEDPDRVQEEYDDFNRDAMDIIEYVRLEDIYEGDTRDGQMHGKGSIKYKWGACYEGEWKNDKQCGQGKYTLACGNVYEGAFMDCRFHGRGKYTWASGGSYEGSWQNGEMHGQGKMTYDDGERYEGAWEYNFPIGPGTIRRADGRSTSVQGTKIYSTKPALGKITISLTLRMPYASGKWQMVSETIADRDNQGRPLQARIILHYIEGEGMMMYAIGDVFEGTWENYPRKCQGKITYANGDIYEGGWTNGRREGQGKMTYANGDVCEGAGLTTASPGGGT
jgi:hypothetical protein